MRNICFLWCFLLVGAFVSCSEEIEDGVKDIFSTKPSTDKRTICIANGCLKGKLEAGNDKKYDAWYGIPFAAKPLGQLRFRVIIP